MKKRFVWFYLTLIFACHYALDQFTESPYETIINIEERYPDFHIFEPPGVLDATDSTDMSEEDLFAYQEWFTTPPNFAEMETTANDPTVGNSEEDTSAYIPEEPLYTGEFAPRLKITYTPYSALLYQEDEFGLELLCPGYWLQRDVLLIRLECWLKNVALDVADTVTDVVLNKELNLAAIRLQPQSCSQEAELHLANVRNTMPISLDDCSLYVLQEDYALFEMYSWTARPLPFKRAQVLCPIDHLCLRTRPSAPHGEDYALLCDHSLVGMLTADRTKYERVFGKLTLVDLTVAEPWINRILKIFQVEDELHQQLLSDSRFL
ncbi:uncharacterized protein LOC120903836 [Anopheles arabiensis]|uniref:Uncharacterized protein n=1 Tax=Anopheles arabiensis TaxID=7173 RepID=A0A182IH71_ANOAR|nr:uncharacterized protein LOC120903836 [Anopheles arabiensis]